MENLFAVPTVVRVVNIDASPGKQVTVSIETDAQGTENGFGFTLNYDQTKLINPLVQKGADTQTATLIPNTNINGKVGVVLGMPFGQAISAGTKQLVTIRFDVKPTATAGNTALIFNDTPVFREVSDVDANVVMSVFEDGAINILAPSAAHVTIGGFVADAGGNGLRDVQIILTGSDGVVRTAKTTSFGFYHFSDVNVFETYLMTISSRRYIFIPSTRLLTVIDDMTDVNFVSEN